MYLININSLRLEEFIQGSIPPYAILSHRWGSEELSFKEVLKNRVDKKKKGYKKLEDACRVAAGYNVGYLWNDTCCIDKKSSAELSESINSMFSWYRDAKLCIVYLEDVDRDSFDTSFQASVWFRRSWTLQELLAPSDVRFFDRNWHLLGSKESLAEQLTATTKIPRKALLEQGAWRDYLLAIRMSWASSREATRTEDVAYSLLGIFEVNMPLLYGEGDKAFRRLQEEIMKRSTDVTLLLWGLGQTGHCLLASSPAQYHLFNHNIYLSDLLTYRVPTTLTNIGLELGLELQRWKLNTYAAIVAHGKYTDEKDEVENSHFYAILLHKNSYTGLFYRIGVETIPLIFMARRPVKRKLIIMLGNGEQNDAIRRSEQRIYTNNVVYGFQIIGDRNAQLQPAADDSTYEQPFSISAMQWSITLPGQVLCCNFDEPIKSGLAIVEWSSKKSGLRLWIELCFDLDSHPCVHVRKSPQEVTYDPCGEVSVLELSDIVELNATRKVAGGSDLSRTAIIKDDETGDESFFMGGNVTTAISGLIPEQLLPPNEHIRVAFSPPGWQEPNYWSFAIFTVNPRPNLHDQAPASSRPFIQEV